MSVFYYKGHTIYIDENNVMTLVHNKSGIVNLQTKINNVEDAFRIANDHINTSISAQVNYINSLRTLLTNKQYNNFMRSWK